MRDQRNSENASQMKVTERRKRRQREANEGTRRKRCMRFLYNKEEKTICLRTPFGWFKVSCYYIIFLVIFSALFLFFSWYDVHSTMKVTAVKNKERMLRRSYPGGTFIGSNDDMCEHSIIWYSMSGANAWKDKDPGKYVRTMRRFVQEQERACAGKEDCIFNNKTLGPCSEWDYGFKEGRPCLFLKLSKLTKWKPRALASAPDDFPDAVKRHFNKSRSCVWVNCEAHSPLDKDLIGSLSIYPEPAFHEDYFLPELYDNSTLHPVVAVQLKNLKPGYVVDLQCEIFADNIYSKMSNKISRTYVYVHE